jgi:hypothetical protein
MMHLESTAQALQTLRDHISAYFTDEIELWDGVVDFCGMAPICMGQMYQFVERHGGPVECAGYDACSLCYTVNGIERVIQKANSMPLGGVMYDNDCPMCLMDECPYCVEGIDCTMVLRCGHRLHRDCMISGVGGRFDMRSADIIQRLDRCPFCDAEAVDASGWRHITGAEKLDIAVEYLRVNRPDIVRKFIQ